jgi:drug/metabolite transporter (DMT)-like permease
MQHRPGMYALLALMPLFFASNLLIGRSAAGVVEPWSLAFWRWIIAAIILLPFGWTGAVQHWRQFLEAWREILVLAILGMLICGGVVYVSLQATTATNATLIYTASSLIIVVMDTALFGQRLTLMRSTGVIVGFVGVAAIVLQGEPSRLLTLQFNWGDLGIALCALSWAIYSVMLRAERLRDLPTLPLFAIVAAVGAVTLAPPMVYEALALSAFPTTGRAWASVLALAIFPSVLAYGIYQLGVEKVGPSVTGVFLYLIPVYGVGLAIALLGEAFLAYHAAGLILVVGGVVLATDPFQRAAR